MKEKNIYDNSKLCSRLFEETGVAILPGQVFGMKPEELTARLAYVDIDGVAAMDAALKINSKDEIDDVFLQNYCPNVLKAISLITDWVNS